MALPLFPVRLFVDAIQIGGDADFLEPADSIESCLTESVRYFSVLGYSTVTADIASLSRWPMTEPEPTVVIHCGS